MPRTPRASVPPRTRSRAAVARTRTVTAALPRTPRVTAKKAAPKTVPVATEVHEDPVEELIRKHAPARAAHHHSTKIPLGYAIAIAAVVILIVFGWWFTLDRNLHGQYRDPEATDPGVVDIIQGGVNQFQRTPSLVPPVNPNPSPTIPSPFEQRLENAQNP